MTMNEILEALQETQGKLEAARVDDDSKLELDILILQLRRALAVAVFDPLKDLDEVTVADTSQLTQLVREVQTAIQNEQKRVTLVKKITTTAKVALKAAGIPIPS